MQYRSSHRLGVMVSEIGLGCWQLGAADWGDVPEPRAMEILRAADESGVTFFDTADVYGAGRSEMLIGKYLRTRGAGAKNIFIATKLGRLNGYPDGYSAELLRECTLRSIERLGVGALDLTQLHCIPMRHLQSGKVFDWLRKLKDAKLIKHFGASVETMEEAKICLQHADCDSLQIIFNIFRQKPIDELFAEAKEKGVAIIVRLPLASGLLAGTYNRDTAFAASDHRNYNRNGEKFNVGETFAGLEFARGVELADRIKTWVPSGLSMAEFAIRWILDHDAVTSVIPGASKPQQAISNARPSDLAPLSANVHKELRELYAAEIAESIRGPY
jgi:aryl-alcohol dehydrogenase-like predicted oxidoreductase